MALARLPRSFTIGHSQRAAIHKGSGDLCISNRSKSETEKPSLHLLCLVSMNAYKPSLRRRFHDGPSKDGAQLLRQSVHVSTNVLYDRKAL